MRVSEKHTVVEIHLDAQSPCLWTQVYVPRPAELRTKLMRSTTRSLTRFDWFTSLCARNAHLVSAFSMTQNK